MSVFDTPPKHSKIWTYPEILRRMITLKKKGGFRWQSYGVSGEGRKLWYTRFGNVDNPESKRIMICCRQHGTEYTSTHSMIHMMNSMVLNHNEWEPILNNLDIIVIPVYNPDGASYYDHVRTSGSKMHYKIMGMVNLTTGRTIKKLSGDPNRDHEKRKWPETKAFAALMDDFKPQVFLDLHNFGFMSNVFLVKPKEMMRKCLYPLVDNNPEPQFRDLQRKSVKLANLVQDALMENGLLPGKINELYPHRFNMDSVLRKIGCAPNYYMVKKGITGITFETMGDFGMGDLFIHQSVPATLLGVKKILTFLVNNDL